MKECDSEMGRLKKVIKKIKEKKSEIKQQEQLASQLAANEKVTSSILAINACPLILIVFHEMQSIANKIEATQSKTSKLAQMYGARKVQAEQTLEETRAELQVIPSLRHRVAQ